MPALFPPWSNRAFRIALVVAGILAISALCFPMVYVRTPFVTDEHVALEQPVAFDHRHHVLDEGIACLYCHADAERSAYAGLPSTDVCMGCHSQVWNQSPLLEPVRQSYFSGRPLAWNRVHSLAEFVYFDHSVHVARGVACEHCHGRVETMARVEKTVPLDMNFCLDCHRDPRKQLGFDAQRDFSAMRTAGGQFPAHTGHAVTELTTCSTCHR
jgi:hypothetical protein